MSLAIIVDAALRLHGHEHFDIDATLVVILGALSVLVNLIKAPAARPVLHRHRSARAHAATVQRHHSLLCAAPPFRGLLCAAPPLRDLLQLCTAREYALPGTCNAEWLMLGTSVCTQTTCRTLTCSCTGLAAARSHDVVAQRACCVHSHDRRLPRLPPPPHPAPSPALPVYPSCLPSLPLSVPYDPMPSCPALHLLCLPSRSPDNAGQVH